MFKWIRERERERNWIQIKVNVIVDVEGVAGRLQVELLGGIDASNK